MRDLNAEIGTVTHDEAEQLALCMIDKAFNNPEIPGRRWQASIPVSASDTDVRLMAYIRQQRALATAEHQGAESKAAELPCPGCGGSGYGAGRVDGDGDVYQETCRVCGGHGRALTKAPVESAAGPTSPDSALLLRNLEFDFALGRELEGDTEARRELGDALRKAYEAGRKANEDS